MGKVTKFTGSKLLGAELRRLRGGRSLKQVAELSKTPPLSERIAPVAAPTLSQIENGISFPSLESLHALATLYQASVQQLLDLVVQERLLSGRVAPASLAEAKERFQACHRSADWHEGLAIAAWAETVTSGRDLVLWRANRALVLVRLGMRQDALQLLDDCLNDADLPEDRRFQLHQSLAEIHAEAGHAHTAAMHARMAKDTAPSDLTRAQRRRLAWSRAYHAIQDQGEREAGDERELRRALADLDEALEASESGDIPGILELQVHRARCLTLMGNRLLARQDLERTVSTARSTEDDRALLAGLLALGELHRLQGRPAKARAHFEEAGSLAASMDNAAFAFEAYFEAYGCLSDPTSKAASRLLRRCERFHPFVTARTRNRQRFDALERGTPS